MMIRDVLLSEYGKTSSRPSPVNQLMTDFAVGFRDGCDINLGVGYVNERTIPHQQIQIACEKVLAHPEKYRAALNYGGAQGSPNLIASLRRFHIENRIGGITEQTLNNRDIVIGANGATSLLESITHLLPAGIIFTADPMYYIYCNDLERKGFKVVAVPEDDEGLDTERLKAKLAALGNEKEAIRFFYVVTVNNPTCTILSNTRKQKLVDIVTRLSYEVGQKIPLFFDNAYSDLVHDSTVEPLVSALCYDTLGIVYEVGTLSKILAPGLRIGYLIGSKGPFLNSIIQRTSDIGFSAPLINQEIASYLLDHGIEAQIETVNNGYQQKAKQVKTWMAKLLGDNIQECRGGSAGFYFYLTLANVATGATSDFFKFLTRTTRHEAVDGPSDAQHPKVIYIPGEHCVHPNGDMVEVGKRQLRISYGFEELPQIHTALKLMKSAIAYSQEN
ncbi:PLP-dependent aminotransferase family protein [Candidatus Poribacteria bacterium]|nr:PLP-dependent aminotransferase family protein [Candidatus Poribacteria bacterium]MYB02082.1 PLP-dependent aminotransferase family protein [Candidatus Poribacteria bacterium]